MSRQWTARAKAALNDHDLDRSLKYLRRAQEIEDTPILRRRINRVTRAIRDLEGPDAITTESDYAEVDLNQNTPKKRRRSYSTTTAKGSCEVKRPILTVFFKFL